MYEIEDYVDKKILATKLLKYINTRDKQIICEVFGFYGQPPKNFTEIAEELGVTPVRIRQIFLRGFTKIRKEVLDDLKIERKLYE